MNAHVIADWQVKYSDPLILRAGEGVTLGERDTEWPGWIWCINEAGKGGWVPEQYIEIRDTRGVARQDYSAIELAVKAGEQVRVGQRLNGWAWCTNASGQSGWVPERNLDMISA
jgi:uncharacterized protein YgiM (DUF1202 family)